MYARRLNYRSQKWNSVFQHCKHLTKSLWRDFILSPTCDQIALSGGENSRSSLIRKFSTDRFFLLGFAAQNSHNVGRLRSSCTRGALRLYSAKGDGSNASEDKHVPVRDATSAEKGKILREKAKTDSSPCTNSHARLGEQDQMEWMSNEKLSIETKKKESPFLSRRERFKNEFLRRVVPWEKITVSWETFPYYIDESTKKLLVECAASHLKHKKFSMSYGARLTSSSGRILLQSIPGTELYRERLVRALARDLKVPLLVLDSSVLAPYDFSEECTSESESDDENAQSGEECTSDSEVDDENENDASNEEDWGSSNEVKSASEEDEVDVQASAEALKKLVPHGFEELEKRLSGESESTSEPVNSETSHSPEQLKRPFTKGDRVKYVGPAVRVEADNRSLSSGQRGEVYEVNGDRVAVILDDNEKKKGEKDEKIATETAKASIYWIHIQDIERDLDIQAEDWSIAIEALCEVLPSLEPLIVYFPDSYQWLSRAVPKSKRKDFIRQVEEAFDRLQGPVVLICGQNKLEAGSKEKEKFVSFTFLNNNNNNNKASILN